MNNINWLHNFQELLEYKKEYGHCNVPSTHDDKSLASWVHRQRTQYKKSELSEERIARLNVIGFSWYVSTISTDDMWFNRFEHLKQYKSKNGDCNVPATYEENQPLANWVRRQRAQYKLSKLLKDRINMLNAIGFEWTTPPRQYTAWNDKLEELKLYKCRHGDCNVPAAKYNENQSLGYWVERQRTRYKHSTLTEERINMLNDIGFEWTVPPNANKTEQLELDVGNEIETEQEDTEDKQYHELVAIERINSNTPTIEAPTEEKVQKSCTESLQDRIQVLCKLSILFQEQKDAIYANIKKRKLDNSSALLKR